MGARTVRRVSVARCAVVLAVAGLLVGAAAGSASARPRVVLGSPSYYAPGSTGFGIAHPRAIFNGGDPSGSVFDIHWSSWGGETAFGVGKHPIFKPGGGYYKRPVRARLHAVALGRCYPGGPLTYRRLYVRDPVRPGGPLGKWYPWSGSSTLCHSPS
jgi:hypothetical protein